MCSKQVGKKGTTVLCSRLGVTGIGISARQRKRIFTKFNKANPMAPGAGIGLTLAEKIVKMHRGRIEVESALGRGSTFKIIIPHVEDEKSGKGNPS